MMNKPRVFVGSSSEGLQIGEAMFSYLSHETEPTLWTHQIFTPGAYPLEALDDVMRRHFFAVLVASPDDELVKRGVSAPAMRDNLLLEFGLFAGAFGRKRVFFVCPDSPKLDLPSDLFGVLTATYGAQRAKGSPSDRAAAVQTAGQEIRDVILGQWAALQKLEIDREATLRASRTSQAIRRLSSVSTRLRDALMALQTESLAAFSDPVAFKGIKERASEEIDRIAHEFDDDSSAIGAQQEVEQLRSATHEALLALPFPQELSLPRAAIEQRVVTAGFGALNAILSGGDPVSEITRSTTQEASERLSGLVKRYSDWWAVHSTHLQQATVRMQDKLFNVMFGILAHSTAGIPT